MRCAAAETDLLDGTPATTTTLPLPAVDLQLELVTARLAVKVGVVVGRRSAQTDGPTQAIHDAAVQAPRFRLCQRLDPAVGADTGQPTGLIGINVADTGHASLVHEKRLYRFSRTRKDAGSETFCRKIPRQRFGTITRLGENLLFKTLRAHRPQITELADVVEEQAAAVGQIENQVRVLAGLGTGRIDEEFSGHLEVRRQRPAGI